jgi:hypothetical protein
MNCDQIPNKGCGIKNSQQFCELNNASGTVFTTLHFILNGPIKVECYINSGLQKLDSDKHSSLLGPFLCYK